MTCKWLFRASLILLLAFLPRSSHALWDGLMADLLDAEPDARIASMGHGGTAMPGVLPSAFSNPASIAFSSRLGISYSFRQNSKATYPIQHHFAGAYQVRPRVTIAAAYQQYNLNGSKNYSAYSLLAVAYRIDDGFSIGTHVGYYYITRYWMTDPDSYKTSPTFNVGLQKHVLTVTSRQATYSLKGGINLANPFPEKFNHANTYGEDEMPAIVRAGLFHQVDFRSTKLDLIPVSLRMHWEGEWTLNQHNYSAEKIGGELRLVEVVSCRIGYIYRNFGSTYFYGLPESWRTYGLGLDVPVHIKDDVTLHASLNFTHEAQKNKSGGTIQKQQMVQLAASLEF